MPTFSEKKKEKTEGIAGWIQKKMSSGEEAMSTIFFVVVFVH